MPMSDDEAIRACAIEMACELNLSVDIVEDAIRNLIAKQLMLVTGGEVVTRARQET